MNVLGMINRSRHVHPGVLIEDALDSSKCIECGQVCLLCANEPAWTWQAAVGWDGAERGCRECNGEVGTSWSSSLVVTRQPRMPCACLPTCALTLFFSRAKQPLSVQCTRWGSPFVPDLFHLPAPSRLPARTLPALSLRRSGLPRSCTVPAVLLGVSHGCHCGAL